LFLQADLSKPEEVKRLFDATIEKFQRLSILVNNAGFMVSLEI
jgi:3-oxoacyl-[acyl-carrier protein] reductase